MKACRGVGASMNPETIAKWEEEHTQMMLKEAPETFSILHYVSYAELKVKKVGEYGRTIFDINGRFR